MTLIASVLKLDRRAIKALRITDPYSLHRVVYSLFPDIRDEEAKAQARSRGLLYADQGGDFTGRQILILSDRQPADDIDGQFGEVRSKSIPERFLDHGNYRFKVVVNPTCRDHASRKLIPIKGREEIAKWFYQRAEKSWGFTPSEVHLDVSRVDVLKFTDKHQNPITLAQAHIQGLLTVTDRSRFQHCFKHGVGRGRAFGCGLMQLVPVLENPFSLA